MSIDSKPVVPVHMSWSEFRAVEKQGMANVCRSRLRSAADTVMRGACDKAKLRKADGILGGMPVDVKRMIAYSYDKAYIGKFCEQLVRESSDCDSFMGGVFGSAGFASAPPGPGDEAVMIAKVASWGNDMLAYFLDRTHYDVNACGDDGCTALIKVCLDDSTCYRYEAVGALVEAGANVNVVDKYNDFPLSIAFYQNDLESMNVLLGVPSLCVPCDFKFIR